MKVWKILSNISSVLLLAIAVWFGYQILPLILDRKEDKPVEAPITITVKEMYEDTLKVNTLARKLSRYVGFEKLYNNLLARYRTRTADTVYRDTVKQRISLDINFMLRVDKVGSRLTIYTFNITDVEGEADNIIEKIKDTMGKVIGRKVLAEGYLEPYVFTIPEDAIFSIYATKGKPKYIETRHLPFGMNAFVSPNCFLFPDRELYLDGGFRFTTKKVDIDIFYRSNNAIGARMTGKFKIF